MNYKIEKDDRLTWILIVCIILQMITSLGIMFVPYQYKNYLTIFIFVICYIVLFCTIICVFLSIFGIPQECITINEDGVLIKSKRKVKKYFWNELLYKIEWKKYYIHNRFSKNKIEIVKKYVFLKDKKTIFTVDNKADMKFIQDNIILKNKVDKKKTIINGEDVIIVKPKKRIVLDIYFVILIHFCAIILILNCVIKVNNIDDIVSVLLSLSILWGIILSQLYRMIKEWKQIGLTLYLVRNKGIYIDKKGYKKFYEFKELDKVETDTYIFSEEVVHTIFFYKDNKKILVLTNICTGFYELLEELKYLNMIK